MQQQQQKNTIQNKDCTHGVDGVDKFPRLAELHQALSEVVEGSLYEDFLLLVVVQQVVPQRLLGERLWVPHNDHTIPSCATQHTRTVLRDGGFVLITKPFAEALLAEIAVDSLKMSCLLVDFFFFLQRRNDKK